MKLHTFLAFTMITLVGCASTPVATYKAATELGSPGYMSAPADNGYYAVIYTGEMGVSRNQVAQFALLRAAEFTTESGYDWFAVISKTPQQVKLKTEKDPIIAHTGGSFGNGPASSTGAGGAGGTSSPRGVSDASTSGGPSTGGFGGGDVPYQVMERWDAGMVPQMVIIIKMGKGNKADFNGLDKAPEIYSAKSIATDIRAKMPH